VCRIFFLSYDMDRSKWQGAGVDLIWLDEEPPEDIFNECLARIVTTRGSIVLTFTPVEGVGWWYDRIWLPAIRGESDWQAFTAALAEHDPENDAEFNVGASLVPHLTREQIIEFAREYPDPEERDIRIFGLVRSKAGLVYKMFSRKVHVVERVVVPAHWYMWGGVDPGFHGFAATLWGQDEAGTSVRIDEHFSSHESTATRLRAMDDMVARARGWDEEQEEDERARMGWHPYRWNAPVEEEAEQVVFFVDTEDPQVVLELNLEAARVGARVSFASLDQGLKARKAGILRLQQLLQPDIERPRPEWVTRETPLVGEPSLYLFEVTSTEWRTKDRIERGDRLAWELERCTWKPPTRKGTQPDDADDNSAGGSHSLSANRYAAMARLGPPEAPKPKGNEPVNEVERMMQRDLEAIEDQANGQDWGAWW